MLFGLQSRSICGEIISKQPIALTDAYEIACSRELTHRPMGIVNAS